MRSIKVRVRLDTENSESQYGGGNAEVLSSGGEGTSRGVKSATVGQSW